MGMLDYPSTRRFWKFSCCAKEAGLFSAELQVASPKQSDTKGIFSFFTKRRRRFREEGGMCDVSLRIRAHLVFLKVKVAAGRLREMRLQTWQGSAKKLVLVDFQSSAKSPLPYPPSFQIFKRSLPSPASKGSPSWFSRILFARKKRKESLFVCGAGIGAFAVFLLHHASAYATHLPALALNAGSRLLGILVKFIQKKCDNAGSKGAACFMQGIRRAASLFQVVLSLLRSTFFGNHFATTALLAILIGVILAGKSDKLQNLLHRNKQGCSRILRTRLAIKLLLVMQLLKRFWAHIGMKQAFLFVLLLAFLSSAVSRLQAFS